MASGSHGILEGVCRVMNAKNHKKGERETETARENKWQQQQQTIKRSLWQSNKKKRAMRIGKQIKTFLREQQLQDAHTCDPWGQEIHIACTKGATAKAKKAIQWLKRMHGQNKGKPRQTGTEPLN